MIDAINKAIDAIGTTTRNKPLSASDAMLRVLNTAKGQIQALSLKGDISDEPEASLVLSAMHATPKPKRMMEILGTGQYELGDVRWLQTLYNRLISEKVPFPRHDQLGVNPVVKIGNQVKIAIAGDWGTGNASSQAIGAEIRKLAPDHTIHLGDTYYSGEPEEVRANFLGKWPAGKVSSYAIPGNHEMYSGGEGYFREVLTDPQFQAQQGLSYFALENDNWVIIGLDTAYWAQDTMYKQGFLDPVQLDWLGHIVVVARQNNKRVIFLTHHNGLDLPDMISDTPQNGLWDEALHTAIPDYWYWGHNHSGIAFKPFQGVKARCVGHGGIPYEPLVPVAGVEWTETELAGDPEEPRRALNGFMLLSFDNANLTEEFRDEKGNVRWRA